MSISDISFKDGYSASYYICFVDKRTWADFGRMDITGGSINRSTDVLIESADISCINYQDDSERLVRVYMDVKQGSNIGHIPLFTGWATSPEKSINGTLVENTLQCYSVLKPAQDILLPPGWYAPLETDSEALIEGLLKPTGAPINFIDSPSTLKEALIAEENENNLSMAELVISAVGFAMRINGDGSIDIYEKPNIQRIQVAGSFDYINNDIFETQLSDKFDWYDCPNVFRAIADDSYAVARDEDAIDARGREIWAQESSCDLKENESISEYAVRRLKELQTVYRTIEYTRRFQPDIYPLDFVRIHYPTQGISGVFQVTNQTINFGYNASTSEEVIQIE